MAKDNRNKQDREPEMEQEKKEMSLEEARAYRASLYKPSERTLSDQEKREQFRVYWAQEKSKYGKSKDLEEIIWLHLKSAKKDSLADFEAGIAHFGLKKLS